jgi:hypothetical protein
MSSEERADAELRTLIRRMIPVVKTRAMRAADRSPETFTEEIWTLAALYTVSANLAG